MNNQDFTLAILVDKSPKEAFDAINDVRGWWSGAIEGRTDRLGEEWTYRYKDFHYSKQKIAEFVPGKKVVWDIVDSAINFVDDKTEWNGTKIVFDIAKKGGETEVRFTHVGLAPESECFDSCSDAWSSYITGSLKSLIERGAGRPNPSEQRAQ
jgi:hypothetical protein